MKYKVALLSLAVLAVSCAKEASDNRPVWGEKVTFSASFGEDVAVKTALSGTKINWIEDDDVISILWDGGSTTAAAQSSGATTSFEATVDAADLYYGVYPSTVASEYSAGALTVTVPAAQHGTFAESNILVASTTSGAKDFSFKNLCSLGQITLSRSDIAEIRFIGANNEGLSGTVTVSLDGSGVPSCEAGTTDKEIVLTPAEGDTFAAGTYYFSLLPQTLSEGVTIILSTTGKTTVLKREGAKAASMSRSRIMNFGTLDGAGIPSEMQLTFDFKGTPQDGWPTANAAVAHVDGGTKCNYSLDGADYEFILADADGASGLNVFWPATNKLYLRYEKRYLGLPKIEGYKLVRVVCTCYRWNSTTVPKIGIVDRIFDKNDDPFDGTHDSAIYGALQEWGATGTVHTYNLSGTALNTVYYLCSKNPSGFNQLKLTYSKTDVTAPEDDPSGESISPRIGTFNLRDSSSDTGTEHDWTTRKDRVRQSIEACDYDIWGIQEVNQEKRDWLRAEFGDVYAFSFFDPYSADGSEGEGVGQGIAYRKSKYTLSDWHYFWSAEDPDVMSTTDSEKYNRGGCCGVFTHTASGIQVFVMNTHGSLDDEANRIYAHVYVDREILYNSAGLPSFFVGDMNETPNEQVESPYGTYTSHWKDSLKETAQSNRTGPNNSYNNFSSQSGLRREDHIFFRGSKIIMKHYTIDNTLFDGGLYASDHFPVYVDVKVLK